MNINPLPPKGDRPLPMDPPLQPEDRPRGQARPANTTYELIPGDTWAFFDGDDERAWIEWTINSIDAEEGTVAMTKVNGAHPGYRAKGYPLDKVRAPKWKFISGAARPEVTFECPRCGKDKPIRIGDYVCEDCRVILDKEDE